MAEKKTIIINGNLVDVWQFSHSAQDIDDATDRVLKGWTYAMEIPIGNGCYIKDGDGQGQLVLGARQGDRVLITDSKVELIGAEGLPLKNVAAPTDDKDAANKKYVDDRIASVTGGAPTGCIVMWSGAASDVPDGWYLCDGTNGTPDLRDRFVVGAGNAYTPGATGGNAQVTLTVDQLPEHNHSAGTLATESGGSHTHTYYRASAKTANQGMSGGTNQNVASISSASESTGSDGIHTHAINGETGSVGSGQAVSILPPYYALCYIIKGA